MELPGAAIYFVKRIALRKRRSSIHQTDQSALLRYNALYNRVFRQVKAYAFLRTLKKAKRPN